MYLIIFEIINIFSASLPYYFQLKKFKETQNSEGYSLKVSIVIIISSIIRVVFWFGKFYRISLLFQSILLIVIQIFLIRESVKHRIKPNDSPLENLSIEEIQSEFLNLDNFLNWSRFSFYVVALLIFLLMLFLITDEFGLDNIYYVEFLGIMNAVFESILALPQILENKRTRNVANLSWVLIGSWFLGDFIKTYFFIITSSPVQFILLGVTQVSLNFVIVYQVIIYSGKKA